MKTGLISSAVVAVALAVTLGACGGSDGTTAGNGSSSSAPQNADAATADEPAEGACALLDKAELAEIVGGPVNHSNKEATSLEGEGCIWNRKDLKSGAGVVSLIFLGESDQERFAQSGLSPDDESYRPIGDGASMETSSIVVRVGDRAFSISGTGPFQDPATLEALAKTAASRR